MQVRPWVMPTAIGVVSFGAGVAVGALFKYKKRVYELQKHITLAEDRVRELDKALEARHLRDLNEWIHGNGERPEGPIDYTRFAKADLIEAANEVMTESTAPVEQSIFDHIDVEEWDWAVEIAERTTDAPYILQREEFVNNESGYQQTTLTWYEGDSILCDEEDVPIPRPDKLVGQLIFGKGSEDPSICYIRNDTREAEYEILLEHGHYQTIVLGAQIEEEADAAELKHSQRPHKMRMD